MAPPDPGSLRALIYARESKYDVKTAYRSPDEQVEVGREWCDERGYTVAEVIVEAGIGASRHARKERPGWKRAKQLIADRHVDILVTWASSRATRQLGEYVELRDLCAEAGVLWCRKGQVLDLSRSGDRLVSGIEAVVDDHAVEVLREDLHRTLRSNALNGRPQGRTLYGYRRVYDPQTRALVRQEPHPDQAPVVVWLFAAYLAGHSTNTLEDGLRLVDVLTAWSGGLPTSTGVGTWKAGTIRRILTNPAYKGRRIHNGVDVAAAIWPELVTPRTFDRVQRRLAARSVKRGRVRRGHQLLAGLAVCGVCGTRLTHMPPWRQRGAFYYCPARGRHVSRMTDALDLYVSAVLLERLALLEGDPGHAVEDPAVQVGRQRIAAGQEQLAEAMAAWKAGRLSLASFSEMESHLAGEIADAERAVRRALIPLDIDVPPADQLQSWWTDELTPEQRREVMAAWVVGVVVHPVGKGNRRYEDADYTDIEWRR